MLATEQGTVMERDDKIVVRNMDDLHDALFKLQFYFNQARLRGDEVVCEIWSPMVTKVPRRAS